MLLSFGGAFAHEIGRCAADPCDSKCDYGKEEAELFGAGQPRVLEIEAARLDVTEQTFDSPALAISVEWIGGQDIAGDDQEFTTSETASHEVKVQAFTIACGLEGGFDRFPATASPKKGGER